MNYLFVPGRVLENTAISAECKLIIAFFNALRKANSTYWGSINYLADKLGIEHEKAQLGLEWLIENRWISKGDKGYFLFGNPETSQPVRIVQDDVPSVNSNWRQQLDRLLSNGWELVTDTETYIQLAKDGEGIVNISK